MNHYTRKIGTNRGAKRLWLEGKILLDNGFNHKQAFVIMLDNDKLIITTVFKGDLKVRHIAGTPERPIIDINSNSLLSQFSGEVQITVYDKTIVIAQ
jgi:hypothetical protein